MNKVLEEMLYLQAKETAGAQLWDKKMLKHQEEIKQVDMFNKENAERPVTHEEKQKEGASRPVVPVNHDLSNTQVAIKEDVERPVNQVDQPFTSARRPGCLDEQILPSVDEHHYTDATEGAAPRRAKEEWVVVLPQRKTKALKKSAKAPSRPVVDNTRRNKSINQERRRSQDKEYEVKFVEDLGAAFLSKYPSLRCMITGHTTGCPDSAPAPNRVLPQQVRKAPKRSVKAPRRPIVPASTTPRWKVSKFKQQVGNNTRKRCKSYGRMNTTSCRDRC